MADEYGTHSTPLERTTEHYAGQIRAGIIITQSGPGVVKGWVNWGETLCLNGLRMAENCEHPASDLQTIASGQ